MEWYIWAGWVIAYLIYLFTGKLCLTDTVTDTDKETRLPYI